MIFSFISGYVDTVGYINLDGLCISSVTGNVYIHQGIANILIDKYPPTTVITKALVRISKALSDIIQYYLASKHLFTVYQDHIPNQSEL